MTVGGKVQAGHGRRRSPFDPRLFGASPAAKRTVGLSALAGLVATATIVVQATALASLLASAMPGGSAAGRGRDLAWLASAFAVRGVCALAAEFLARVGSSQVKADLRAALVTAAVRAVPTDTTSGAGDVATLAGRGLDALDVYIGRCVPDLVLAVAAPLALAVVVGALDWLSGIIILIVLGLFPLFGALVGTASGSLAVDRWRRVEALGRHVSDIFAGLPVLKALGRSAEQRRIIERASEALRQDSLATLRVAFLSALVLDTLASISVALIAVPLGLRLLDGGVRLPAALAVLIIAPEVFLPLRRASAEFHESAEGLAAAGRAFEHIDTAPPLPAASRILPSNSEAEDVGRRVRHAVPTIAPVMLDRVRVEVPGRPEPILAGVSLAIAPGETVVIVGPNGGGKTTLLSVLLGFVAPSDGSVSVAGIDLAELDLRAWRRSVSYLPARPTLLRASLADNLRLAAAGASDDDLYRALDAAGATDLVGSLPGGLNTVLGEGGRRISAGELQRVALARAIVRPAWLYLLDEPTVHLDAATEAIAVEGLRRSLEGRSAVVVTHRPEVLSIAHRVLRLERGSVVATDTSSRELCEVPS